MIGTALLLGSCKNLRNDLDENGIPKVLKVGISTSEEDATQTFSRMEPLRDYLERELEIPVKFIRVSGYAPVVEALKAKKVHIAGLAPFAYLIARRRANIEALYVIGKEGGSPRLYYTCIITRKNSGLETIEDIKERAGELSIAFSDPASTSGHAIPRKYLMENGIDPDRDFKNVIFSTSQTASVLSLNSGKLDIACAMLRVVELLSNSKTNINKEDFNYIWISEPIPSGPSCIRKDIDPAFRKKVQDAFLNLKYKDTTAWYAVTQSYKNYISIPYDSLIYLPAYDSMYDDLEKLVETIGLFAE
jgi:phosphonate transport system substrate-binding protein